MNLIFSIFATKILTGTMETKVVLITGASSGIGLSSAEQLMNKGVKVYAASRRGGKSHKAELGDGEIIHVKMDVTKEEEIAVVVAQILKENKHLDAVISNAGNGVAGSIEDTSSEEMLYQFETNFFGAVKVIQACIPVFRAQGYGKIIATSSVAAIVPIPFQAFYSAGKSALMVFMQALALELKPFGIQCCSILPGDTKTEFTAARKYTVASRSADSAYADKMKKSVGKMEKDEQNGVEAKVVAKKIVTQILKKKMKVSVVPGIDYKLICFLFNRFPVSLRLWVVGLIYG